MDYKKLIEEIRESNVDGDAQIEKWATAIETLLAEREAAVRDLTEVCKDNPDVCHLCKHLPCVDKNGKGYCLGWQWRGPTPPDRRQTERL